MELTLAGTNLTDTSYNTVFWPVPDVKPVPQHRARESAEMVYRERHGALLMNIGAAAPPIKQAQPT